MTSQTYYINVIEDPNEIRTYSRCNKLDCYSRCQALLCALLIILIFGTIIMIVLYYDNIYQIHNNITHESLNSDINANNITYFF